MPPNVADNFIFLKPRAEWPDPARSKADLVAAIERRVEEVAGNNYEFTQPIQMRFNELISGVRSDLGIKIFGDDLEMLITLAAKVQSVLQSVPGAADVKTEQVSGLPMLTVRLNRSCSLAMESVLPTFRKSSKWPSAARLQALSSRATGASSL